MPATPRLEAPRNIFRTVQKAKSNSREDRLQNLGVKLAQKSARKYLLAKRGGDILADGTRDKFGTNRCRASVLCCDLIPRPT